MWVVGEEQVLDEGEEEEGRWTNRGGAEVPPMIEEPESGTRIDDVGESTSVVLSCPTLVQPHMVQGHIITHYSLDFKM
ncbi:hypothetical protein Pcinc_002365 [Petrolisthes cinctipes]|uniref:Uncharacterized protein n=1 Tax=Petrolisthes cinctipes TaxID=88211 RepID=A0AAE1L2B2_PETCI|nr:hypothetical protein Pcinc_002365 [Petrolisthes cinctipes]